MKVGTLGFFGGKHGILGFNFEALLVILTKLDL